MYTPPAFREDDPSVLDAFMAEHSFATLITQDGGCCHATHLPVLHAAEGGGQGHLLMHLARGNPQVAHLAAGREVLVIYQGPHAYVSPAWYASGPAVPTWNYTAVHVYGVPRLIEDRAGLVAMLERTVEFYEGGRDRRWDGRMPEAFRDGMIRGIVGVEVRITRREGKFKLSQNRSAADRSGVVRALSVSADPGDQALAALMRVREEG